MKQVFGQLVQLPDRPIVAYLVEHDIYINFDFISWTSGQQGGGFSYTRDIPSISNIKIKYLQQEILSLI